MEFIVFMDDNGYYYNSRSNKFIGGLQNSSVFDIESDFHPTGTKCIIKVSKQEDLWEIGGNYTNCRDFVVLLPNGEFYEFYEGINHNKNSNTLELKGTYNLQKASKMKSGTLLMYPLMNYKSVGVYKKEKGKLKITGAVNG